MDRKLNSGENSSGPSSDVKNRSRYILINTLSSYGRDVVDAVVFLILTPLIARILGSETFGLWQLLWAFISFFVLMDMGLGVSVVKYISDAKGKGDMDRQRRIISTLFWIYVGMAVLLVAGVTASVLFFNDVFDIPDHQQEVARAVLIILGMRLAFNMPFGMFRGVLIGYQKLAVANYYKILASICYLALVWTILNVVKDLRTLAVLNMLTGIAPMIAMMIHAKSTLPAISINPKLFDRSLVRQVTSFSIFIMIGQISTLIATRVDVIIIKAFMSLEMVAIYAIAMRLSEKAQQFCFQLIRALTPVFAEMHGSGEESNVRAAWFMGSKLSVAFAMPLLVGLILLAEPLVLAWMGPEFAGSAPALQWLASATLIAVIHGNSSNILSMEGHHKYLAFSMLSGQLLNIVLSVILIQRYGIVGVAVSTFVSSLPQFFIFIQTRACQIHQVSHWKFYSRTVAPSIVPVSIMIFAIYVGFHFRPQLNLLDVAIFEILGVIIFGVVFWFIGFTGKERSYFKKKLNRMRRSFKR